MWKRLWQQEEGQSLVMMALLLSLLLGFTALVVDVGYLYAEKRQLQTAVDAAALAGAQDLPFQAAAVSQAQNYITSNIEDSHPVITTPYQSNSKFLAAAATKEVPTFFAKFLGVSSVNLSAQAVAQKINRWVGEALPFVNLDDNYRANSEIEIWESTGNGDFESLLSDDFDTVKIYLDGTMDVNNPSNNLRDVALVYHDVKYEDGIQITKGVVANVKDEIGMVVDANNMAYVFSLKPETLAAYAAGKLSNKQTIPLTDMVLLQVEILDYDEQKKTIKMRYVREYDVNEGEFPTEFLQNVERGTSKLVK